MIVSDLTIHNVRGLNLSVRHDRSYGIAGVSGSGKSSFCGVLAAEAQKRLVTLLPKVEYQFLFPDLILTNFGALDVEQLPLVRYLRNHTVNLSPRSTVGTHTGIFRNVRGRFAREARTSSEFFSFNLPLNWCPKCKGRGTANRVTCDECKGTRYQPGIRKHTIRTGGGTLDIVSANGLPAELLAQLSSDLALGTRERRVAENMTALGIGYLSLDRTIGTLSGGELARLHLAEHIGSSDSTLFVIDEPSIGMDAAAVGGMLSHLRPLGRGNQIWLIDHSEVVLGATEERLLFGPGSGADGGKVVSALPRCEPLIPPKRPDEGRRLRFENLFCRNVQVRSLELPLGQLVVVTGESGCGKSTLMRDCVAPGFAKAHPRHRLVFVGQSRFQSVSTRSTIATFLGVSEYLRGLRGGKQLRCGHCGGSGLQEDSLDCGWCLGTGFDPQFYGTTVSGSVTVRDVLTRPVTEVLPALPPSHPAARRLTLLVRLGAGYLSLGRPVRTLSTGEFQRVHLATEAGGEDVTESTVFLFDEPSRGLSQNFLNSFVATLRELIGRHGCTAWMIEHNEYLLKNADHVIDFGQRTAEPVTALDVLPYEQWEEMRASRAKPPRPPVLYSAISPRSGVGGPAAAEDAQEYFRRARSDFQGGLLKELSPTARWAFGEVPASGFAPIVAIDFEEDVLYSPRTFAYDLLDVAGRLVRLSGLAGEELRFFDFHDREMHCKACKGAGQTVAFEQDAVVSDLAKPFWDGLLRPEIMAALKNYNYSKIRFLFREIRKTTKLDLAKAPKEMSEDERHALWYGLWDRTFHDSDKGAYYTWRGLNHLIQKYMRSSKSAVKDEIKEATRTVTCPVCEGCVLFHDRRLELRGSDIRALLAQPVGELARRFPEVAVLGRLAAVLPTDTPANADVACLDRANQVRLKLFEIAERQLAGYRFVLNNLLPYAAASHPAVLAIAERNEVVVCDPPGLTATRDEILSRFEPFRIDARTYLWEGLGFDRVTTEINVVKKKHPCSYCKGKGRFEVESPDDTVDVAVVSCSACGGHGLSEAGLVAEVRGRAVGDWLSGTAAGVRPDIGAETALGRSPVMARLSALEKPALLDLLQLVGEEQRATRKTKPPAARRKVR